MGHTFIARAFVGPLSCRSRWVGGGENLSFHAARKKKLNFKKFDLSTPLALLQGRIFLVSHRNLLCIFDMTVIQNILCVAVFFHRSVLNFI